MFDLKESIIRTFNAKNRPGKKKNRKRLLKKKNSIKFTRRTSLFFFGRGAIYDSRSSEMWLVKTVSFYLNFEYLFIKSIFRIKWKRQRMVDMTELQLHRRCKCPSTVAALLAVIVERLNCRQRGQQRKSVKAKPTGIDCPNRWLWHWFCRRQDKVACVISYSTWGINCWTCAVRSLLKNEDTEVNLQKQKKTKRKYLSPKQQRLNANCIFLSMCPTKGFSS